MVMRPTSDHTADGACRIAGATVCQDRPMHLHGERHGTGPRLVLVHGFTQTGRCWGPEADDLAGDHEVVRVDAPGHGRSAEVLAGLRTGASLIGAEGGEATYLGYSMGARLCLHLALGSPRLVRGLVLVSGTAGIEDPAERSARRSQDEATAARIQELGLERFVDDWLAQPLFAGLPPERAFREERLQNTVAGLQSSLDQAGTGAQDPSWQRLERLTMPVLVMAGAHDAKFVALAERLAAGIGDNATLAVIPDAGHTVHLENPSAFLQALRPWLADHNL
jgi:2-succinyl-6-hydroxy-2,4-cyclohexadiene-1-carboxylate synthase